jgi:hypothetical protein
MCRTIVALLCLATFAWGAETPVRVWLSGPQIADETRTYGLWLSDYTGILGVDVGVLVQGQADQAQVQVQQLATDAGFIAVPNAVGDTLLIALARGPGTPSDGGLLDITLSALQPEPLIGLVRVELNGGAVPVDYRFEPYPTEVPADSATFTFSLPAGWSLISLPLTPEDAAVNSLFPDAISAFSFVPRSGYQLVDELETCAGYWLNLPSAGDYVVRGPAALAACTMSLASDWSLIGAPQGGTAVAAFGQNPPDNVISVFGFEYGYFLADQVLAGAGYWVNLEQAGTLSLTGASQ